MRKVVGLCARRWRRGGDMFEGRLEIGGLEVLELACWRGPCSKIQELMLKAAVMVIG